MISVSAQIEALLFAEGKPVSHDTIRGIFSLSEEEYERVIEELRGALTNRGIRLVETYDTLGLATHADAAGVIRSRRKDERSGPLSKAAVETLVIVLYNPGVDKSLIDYIRGVNSQFILRSLLSRGLVTRDVHISGTRRTYRYHPTSDALQHLGVARAEELPQYEEYARAFREAIDQQEVISE